MKKYIILVLSLLLVVLVLFKFVYDEANKPRLPKPVNPEEMVTQPEDGGTIPVISTVENFQIYASFEIYTNGTRRDFTNAMYHNLSPDVHIPSDDPNTVRVIKSGITWSDFFATLPMELTTDCLITGTGQKFCTGSTGELKFYINDVETPDALEEEIKDSDFLEVIYK